MLLFSYAKSINGQNGVSFSMLVKKFYDKSAANGFKMDSKLDFMLFISDCVHELKAIIETPMEELLNNRIINGAIKKVCPNRKVHGKYCNTFLHEQNNLIINYTLQIKNLHKEISPEIAFEIKLSDTRFVHRFQRWIQGPISREYAQHVKKVVNPLMSDIDNMRTEFNKEVKLIDKLRLYIREKIIFMNWTYEELLKSNNLKQIDVCTNELVEYTVDTNTQLSALLHSLRNVKRTLENYNKNRTTWADFLIGLRQYPITPRISFKR